MKYPVEAPESDRRFDKLGRDVGLVIEQHAYDRLDAGRRERLERFLVELLYCTPGLEAVELRLNAGVARPLRQLAAANDLSTADCTAAAHELRVLRPVQLVVVAALDDRGRLCLGSSADEGQAIDDLTERVLDAIEASCLSEGRVVENTVHVVPAVGAAS